MYDQSPHTKRNIVLILLLAVVCIGGMELAVCRFAAPDTFHRITTPVRVAASFVADKASTAAEASAQFLSETGDALSDWLHPPKPLKELETVERINASSSVEEPAFTEYLSVNGQEVLTGGTLQVVYYNQGEAPWNEVVYGGTDLLGTYGCGPTCLSMVVSTLTDTIVTPADMAQWARKNGHWARGHGSYHSIVKSATKTYGLNCVSKPDMDAGTLLAERSSGSMFVALMGPGHFTDAGHFIVLRGATLDGSVLVADPNGRDRSLTAWNPQLILDELSPSRDHGAPLWCISALDSNSATP